MATGRTNEPLIRNDDTYSQIGSHIEFIEGSQPTRLVLTAAGIGRETGWRANRKGSLSAAPWGRVHLVPEGHKAFHSAEEFLDDYIEAAGIADDLIRSRYLKGVRAARRAMGPPADPRPGSGRD